MGALYNKVMLKAQELYKRPKFFKRDDSSYDRVFGGGSAWTFACLRYLEAEGDLIVALTDKEMVLKVAIITFLVKFLFSAVSFRIRRSWRNFFFRF